MNCRHCQRRRANRPRGLCWTCYHAPGVREQFPSTSKFTRRGVGHQCLGQEMPAPTSALPGTEAKVAILEERARLGQCLWHPQDAQRD